MKELTRRQPSELPRILKLAGFGLYVLFVCNLLSNILPSRLVDPTWQWTAITALQNFAFLPVIGTCLLLLGIHLEVRATGRAPMLVRRVCACACVGFLLLIPLQASAIWRLGIALEIPAERMMDTIEAASSEIASSQNLSELNTALGKLPGSPNLPPGFNQPLAKVRQSMLIKLDDDLGRLRNSQKERIAGRRVTQSFQFAKTALISLVFAIFFGAVAGFPNPRLPARLAAANPFTLISKRIVKWERQSSAKRRSGQGSSKPGPAEVVLKAIRRQIKFVQRRGEARKLAAEAQASRPSRRR